MSNPRRSDKLFFEMVRKSSKIVGITLTWNRSEDKIIIGHNSLIEDDQVSWTSKTTSRLTSRRIKDAEIYNNNSFEEEDEEERKVGREFTK